MYIILIIDSYFLQVDLIERAHIIQKTPTNYFSSVVDKFEGKVKSEKLGAAAA